MTRHLALFAACIVLTGLANAQKLAEPARTIYKCTVDGKVVYTDDPCPGAARVDVQTTRGVNKTTGKELVGADVRRERNNEMMAEALRPIFGEDAKQRETRHRRFKLSAQAKAECENLDRVLPAREAEESSVTAQDRPQLQKDLLRMRKHHRELGC
jgi:hypothetical protein